MRTRFFSFIVLAAFLGAGSRAYAQAPGQTQGSSSIDTRSAIQIILLSGLGGAVIGLSTLSFYDNPQRELRNISIAAASAVVVATLYVTFRAAQGQPTSVDLGEGGQQSWVPPSRKDQISLAPDALVLDLVTLTF